MMFEELDTTINRLKRKMVRLDLDDNYHVQKRYMSEKMAAELEFLSLSDTTSSRSTNRFDSFNPFVKNLHPTNHASNNTVHNTHIFHNNLISYRLSNNDHNHWNRQDTHDIPMNSVLDLNSDNMRDHHTWLMVTDNSSLSNESMISDTDTTISMENLFIIRHKHNCKKRYRSRTQPLTPMKSSKHEGDDDDKEYRSFPYVSSSIRSFRVTELDFLPDESKALVLYRSPREVLFDSVVRRQQKEQKQRLQKDITRFVNNKEEEFMVLETDTGELIENVENGAGNEIVDIESLC